MPLFHSFVGSVGKMIKLTSMLKSYILQFVIIHTGPATQPAGMTRRGAQREESKAKMGKFKPQVFICLLELIPRDSDQ